MTCVFRFFLCFFSLGFRASGITCIWFSIEKMFLEVNFCFIFFLGSFLTKKCKIWKIMKKMCLFFEKKRKSYTCCKGVPGAMCCGKLYDSLRFGGILDPRVLCGQLCAFISISALTKSSSANGPLARTANPMMAGMNPFLASMFGPAFALLVPTRAESCWFCFDGSMR